MFDPGVGGLSILAAVRERLPGAPIRYVADSAYAPYGERSDAEILDRCERLVGHLRAAGADDFMQKPFQVERLVDRCCELLDMEKAVLA